MSVYYINNEKFTSAQIANMGMNDFVLRSISKLPSKLYKYFPNTIDKDNNRNYSKEALENNTVYLQTPIKFDDAYDCTINIDEGEFALKRLQYYANLCKISFDSTWTFSRLLFELSTHVYNKSITGCSLYEIFGISADKKIETLTQEIFILSIMKEFNQNNNPDVWGMAFSKALHNEFMSVQDYNVKKFRIACFTESPFMYKMWSSAYADNNKGFCIEYEIPPYSNKDADLFHNLLPVIYGVERTSVLDDCLKDLEGKLDAEVLWNIFKYGTLAKSDEWKEQNEWRLISCDNMLAQDYNCKFFKINKVYLGNRMENDERLKIIDICKRKNIPYIGTYCRHDRYEIVECPRVCDSCYKVSLN